MYRVTSRTLIIEDEIITEYGIADEKTEFCCFTQSKEKAENFARLLNENKVEAVHVADIIEDTFYT